MSLRFIKLSMLINQNPLQLLERTDHYIVHQLLNRYLENPGKQLRPLVVRLFGQLFQLNEDKTETLARAAELIHTASLIHDDVVDEASQRRGAPTLNTLVSNSQAVLAGDFLLARTIVELTQKGETENLKYLAQTLEDIVEAEFLQDQLKKQENSTEEVLIQIGLKKTGSLLGWCSGACAIAAQLDLQTINESREFGENLGVAFQLIDDNLDYSDMSGKDYAKDLKEGLINYTTLNLIKIFPELYYPVYQLRGKEFTHLPWTEKQISQAIEQTEQVAHTYLEKASILLKSIMDRNPQRINKNLDVEFQWLLEQVKHRKK
jgi:geranylgeranyl pyrophosphate synthase